MFDITIDGVSYNYVDKCELDGKNYIVFDNEEGVYVSEYKYENEEFIFTTLFFFPHISTSLKCACLLIIDGTLF